MTKVKWTDSALQDILQIYEYIALDSPYNADAFLDRLMDSAEKQLSVSPLIGRVIPEMNDPAFREIIYKKHRIMYHVDGGTADITHVRHAAREFDPQTWKTLYFTPISSEAVTLTRTFFTQAVFREQGAACKFYVGAALCRPCLD